MSDEPPEDRDSERDPFADLDADPDPDAPGDPFESLAGDPDSEDPAGDPDEWVSAGEGTVDPSGDGPVDDPDAPEDPFETFAAAGSDPEASPGDAEAAAGTPGVPEDDPFADLETGADLDDSVWEDLSVDRDAETVEERGGRRISEVSKHSFCEQCPHFSGPPRVACEHEGTEILEFLDMETVKVVDCPVVRERERLRGTDR